MSSKNQGVSLIELMISLALFSIIISGMLAINLSAMQRVLKDSDGARLQAELNFALESLRLYCVKSSLILPDTRFMPGISGTLMTMHIQREENVLKTTSSDLSDDIPYLYYKNKNNDIVLRNEKTETEEVLISAAFKPVITFAWEPGFEPNFFTATVSGQVGSGENVSRTSKSLGIKLWYATVMK